MIQRNKEKRMEAIQFIESRHFVLSRNKVLEPVDTFTASFVAASESDPTAWNYPNRAAAMRALNGYRHAVVAR